MPGRLPVRLPAAPAQRALQVIGAGLVDHQLHQARVAGGVVVDVDVLDVDLAGTGVCEESGQLARVVGHGDEHRGGRAGRTAVLSGDGARTGDPQLQDLAEGGPVAGGDRVDERVELVADLGQ